MICPFTFTGCLPRYHLELTRKPHPGGQIRNEYIKGRGETYNPRSWGALSLFLRDFVPREALPLGSVFRGCLEGI